MLLLFLIISSLVTHGLAELGCRETFTLYAAENVCISPLHKTPKPYDDAVKFCNDDDKSLIQIKTEQKDKFVSALDDVGDETVLNGVKYDAEQNDYVFLDGSTLSSGYAPWYFLRITTQDCVIRQQNVDSILWDPTSCILYYYFLCEESSKELCPDRWMYMTHGSSRFCAKVFKKKRMTYEAARDYCVEIGGHLATEIREKSQRRRVMKTIKFRAHFWIGLDDLEGTGTAKYVDGTSLQGDEPFKKGQGINQDRGHNCASMKMGRWYGKKCNRRQFFICQKPTLI